MKNLQISIRLILKKSVKNVTRKKRKGCASLLHSCIEKQLHAVCCAAKKKHQEHVSFLESVDFLTRVVFRYGLLVELKSFWISQTKNSSSGGRLRLSSASVKLEAASATDPLGLAKWPVASLALGMVFGRDIPDLTSAPVDVNLCSRFARGFGLHGVLL